MARRHGKNYLKACEKAGNVNLVMAPVALSKVKECAFAKFDESVDVDINLSIDPTKGDQVVRGSVVLPNSSGKAVRVVVFAKGDKADEAEKAGADFVGAEDLVDKILGGWMDFDNAIATPDLMGLVGKVAKILGPRGLLPNKKLGTVTFEVADVVNDLKKGRLFFKNDKGGAVHFAIGKLSLGTEKLEENLRTFIKSLVAAKPASAKGKFLKSITVSSTMGVGVAMNPDEFLK
ncbi:MAG: 50S ribosomal protein L1 [candidate division TM6 bacterium GW2011_GWF2_32_72]|nr:MAG: 50S ribosomal protein L1 [candidate division TM6 bacterium GW2011_GWF2_32_72]